MNGVFWPMLIQGLAGVSRRLADGGASYAHAQEVLHYNENYGAEICNTRWLKQFHQINTSSFFTYNTTVDGISGATLSVQSISTHIWNVTEKLKDYLKQK